MYTLFQKAEILNTAIILKSSKKLIGQWAEMIRSINNLGRIHPQIY